jgi:hypothetical protein
MTLTLFILSVNTRFTPQEIGLIFGEEHTVKVYELTLLCQKLVEEAIQRTNLLVHKLEDVLPQVLAIEEKIHEIEHKAWYCSKAESMANWGKSLPFMSYVGNVSEKAFKDLGNYVKSDLETLDPEVGHREVMMSQLVMDRDEAMGRVNTCLQSLGSALDQIRPHIGLNPDDGSPSFSIHDLPSNPEARKALGKAFTIMIRLHNKFPIRPVSGHGHGHGHGHATQPMDTKSLSSHLQNNYPSSRASGGICDQIKTWKDQALDMSDHQFQANQMEVLMRDAAVSTYIPITPKRRNMA